MEPKDLHIKSKFLRLDFLSQKNKSKDLCKANSEQFHPHSKTHHILDK